ncbi:MAG: hypothetical protein KDN05_25370, partial [Verrucomicrobiae bacterium]|nr:hypothetical protein [Verrucomicrobiae bacterium]
MVVRLNGGVLQGGTATVFSNGINGHGLISAKLINETRITADVPGKTLICQTAASDNDWDGAGGLGELIANQGTLDLRDIATFGFTGKVTAVGGGRVFANNFALDFNPGSTLTLAQGTYEASSSTDLGGAVAVAAGGPSTLIVQDNRFLIFEPTCTTTLNGNLLLDNNNIGIRSGASFAGNGGLVVLPGSHLVMEAGANANVLLENQGTLRPAGFT